MPQDREVELKFLLAEEEVARLAGHPLLAAADTSRSAQHLRATYFDTPDCQLRDKLIGLRVRDEGLGRKQTLKQATGSALDRHEWETEADGDRPAPEWLASTPLAHVFRPRVIEALEVAFTVEVERQTFSIREGDAVVEGALDRGVIQAAGRSLPVLEFELELKHGEPADLFAVGRRLVSDLALVPSFVSKAERGYRLREGTWGQPTRADDPRLAPDMPVPDAFQSIAQACLREMLLNLQAFAPDGDVEIVHRSRVALRRLRAAMTLFGPVIGDPASVHLRGELKWMSDLLGSARDLDVFQSDVFDPAARDPEILGGFELAAHMRERQREAHLALAAGLASPRWRCVLMDLLAWLADGEWRRGEPAAVTLEDFVGPRLRRRRKHVAVSVAALKAATPHERHRLRIQAKKLRYALEFFVQIPRIGKGSKAYRALLAALEDLQSALGALHDHEARQDLLRRESFSWGVGEGGGNRASFAAGLLAGAAPDESALLGAAAKALRRIGKANPF